jgi:hypothetical protein
MYKMFKMEIFLNWIKSDQFMCDVVQSQCIILLIDIKKPSYSGFLWQISCHFTDCFAWLQAAQCLMLYQFGVL